MSECWEQRGGVCGCVWSEEAETGFTVEMILLLLLLREAADVCRTRAVALRPQRPVQRRLEAAANRNTGTTHTTVVVHAHISNLYSGGK